MSRGHDHDCRRSCPHFLSARSFRAALPPERASRQVRPQLPGSCVQDNCHSQVRRGNVIPTGASGQAGEEMSVIRFPGRRRLPQYVEEEVAGYGAESDPFADGATPCSSGSESADLDYGAEDPGLPPGEKFTRKPRQKNGRRSPADVIARSLFPAGHARGASNPVPATPADIIAQALYPSMRDSAQDMLKQSFWQVWLQHRDYLKKKAFIFWTGIARMPRTP
jgi:hypothetical protein